MSRPRIREFAAAGAAVSLLLAVIGRRMDMTVPAIPLDHQVLYNWLTLFFSTPAFLFRIANPDGPIVHGLFQALFIAALNALWYAALRGTYQGLRNFGSALHGPLFHAASGRVGPAVTPSHRHSPSELLAERFEGRPSQ